MRFWTEAYQAPTMDIGMIDLVKRGEVPVLSSPIVGATETGLTFEDGTELELDGIVFATGYELVGGHTEWLDAELSEKLGSGLEPIFDGRIGANAAPSTVEPALRFLWGNLGMIRDSASSMASQIKEELAAA